MELYIFKFYQYIKMSGQISNIFQLVTNNFYQENNNRIVNIN